MRHLASVEIEGDLVGLLDVGHARKPWAWDMTASWVMYRSVWRLPPTRYGTVDWDVSGLSSTSVMCNPSGSESGARCW